MCVCAGAYVCVWCENLRGTGRGGRHETQWNAWNLYADPTACRGGGAAAGCASRATSLRGPGGMWVAHTARVDYDAMLCVPSVCVHTCRRAYRGVARTGGRRRAYVHCPRGGRFQYARTHLPRKLSHCYKERPYACHSAFLRVSCISWSCGWICGGQRVCVCVLCCVRVRVYVHGHLS